MVDKKTILLVEDEEKWITRISHMLEDSYTLLVAKNSDEAFSIIEENDINLILLDIRLEGSKLQGNGILKEVVQKQPDINVVMITCVSLISVVEECFNLGAKWYIEKKSSKDEILRRIKRALDNDTYLGELYSGFKSPGESLINSTAYGKEVAAFIEGMAPSGSICAQLTQESMLKCFFLHLQEVGKICFASEQNAERVSMDFEPSGEMGVNNDEVVIYGFDGDSVLELVKQLGEKNMAVFPVNDIDAYVSAIKDKKISSVLINASPKKALPLIWQAKVHDPRIVVSVYSIHETDQLGAAISAKRSGCYSLIDRREQIVNTVANMQRVAVDNFSLDKYELFLELYREKCNFLKGYREYRTGYNAEKAEALYKAGKRSSSDLTDKERDRILFGEKVLLPLGYK